MANQQGGVKGKQRNVGAGNILSATISTRPVAVKAPLSKTTIKKVIGVKPNIARDIAAIVRLIKSMDLDEMLEASKVVEMGMKREKIPAVASSKARKCASEILRLYRRNDTKPLAEKMIHDLNVQIIKVNKETADAVEAKRLYRELMAEEGCHNLPDG